MSSTAVLFSKSGGDGRSNSRKVLNPTPTRRKSLPGQINPLSQKRALWSSVHHKTRRSIGVWLRVRMLKSLVFSFRTTVRAIRDSLREADILSLLAAESVPLFPKVGYRVQTYLSAEIDFVALSGMTGL